jgi:hypothetical protein
MSNKRKCNGELSVEDLKNDTYIPRLSEKDIVQIMTYVQQDRRDGLAEKLLNLKIDYDFDNEFGGNVSDKELSRLSSMCNGDIKQIKDELLYAQADALVTYIKKGYITVEDM